MKKGIILICAMVLFCGLGANAQDPFKNLTENPSVVSYKVPDISGFVTGYLSDPQDEHAGYLSGVWKKHLKNQALEKDEKVTVDSKNGYVSFESGPDKEGYKSVTEMCYWNCADGLHKLFAENVIATQNGKPIYTEFSGLYIYVYDNATQTLYFVDQDLLGITEELHGEISFSLPRQGKDIKVFFGDGTQKTLSWNGKGFTLKDKK
jgi:hypothetical protein